MNSKEELEKYKQEAKEKWGNTEAWKQSQERTKNWGKEDFARIKKQQDELMQKFAKAMDLGPTHDETQSLVKEHRKSIEQFYDLGTKMYRGLAELYIADPRFTATYEKYRVGLAHFVHDAIIFYCDKEDKKS